MVQFLNRRVPNESYPASVSLHFQWVLGNEADKHFTVFDNIEWGITSLVYISIWLYIRTDVRTGRVIGVNKCLRHCVQLLVLFGRNLFLSILSIFITQNITYFLT